MKIRSIKILIACLWLVLLFLPADLLLAAEVKPPKLHVGIGNTELKLDTISCVPGQECDIGWISQYIVAIYKYGIILAAVLTTVMIMVGGFLWLMSGGSSNRVSKAKEFITNALMGLLLALFSYMLLYTINPRLTALGPISVYAPKEIEFEEGGVASQVSRGSFGGTVDPGTQQTLARTPGASRLNGARPETISAADAIIQEAARVGALPNGFTITSGLRPNDTDSQHSLGTAFDVSWSGITQANAATFIGVVRGLYPQANIIPEITPAQQSANGATGPNIHIDWRNGY